ncbi:MAG: aminopeptidase N [Geminicoccaceae bacterium]
MSQADTRQPVLLQDYRPPAFLTPSIDLEFVLEPEATRITSRQRFARNRQASGELVLFGEDQALESISLDGVPLPAARYRLEGDRLMLVGPPDQFTLEITSRINPKANTSLMGLYLSNGVFCTQCEPEGFRRIAFSQDRPDVMSVYRVRIEADKAAYPALLSNGNLLATGELAGGRHWAQWEDPFPKPSYLFALVAGDLACLADTFVTRSGRTVQLRIYSEPANIDQCHHAMVSLKKAMKWDEDRYGLEYDLDLFQIVAVNDFNFGAMENKGLNIFNTSATLARSDTSTDFDFVNVERIIAHEYLHNWTGNRVTCRDWFQLTLKEGLTVFRDQQFSSDMHSAAVKRIGDVAFMRDAQFAEDAGPLAHSIRPDRYIEINNFYTGTVYQKGAEIIRMLHTLVGEECYQEAIRLYFERFDGQAVTCEDFVHCIADASGRDLGQFMRWYEQAGTPELKVKRNYDPARQALTLEISQSTPATPGQPDKLPFHIPIRLGLLGTDGAAQPLQLEGENEPKGTDRVIELKEATQSFTFLGLPAEPIPSLLRGFSAPVKLDAGYNDAELREVIAHDTDPFTRWDAGQRLAVEALLAAVPLTEQPEREGAIESRLIGPFSAVLDRAAEDPAFVARALTLPSAGYLGQQMSVIDVDGLSAVLRLARHTLGKHLRDRWIEAYLVNRDHDGYSIDSPSMSRRSLKNLALQYLAAARESDGSDYAWNQFDNADNMTDSLAALRAIVEYRINDWQSALTGFYHRWQNEPLVVNKWFSLQAGIEDEGAVERIEGLLAHPAFSWSNPNRVRAVLGAFATMNLPGFHRRDGAGYRLLADKVLDLDRRNPQVAARLLSALGRWRRFDPDRQARMRAELERVVATSGLSRDTFEIASKSLA